MHILDRIAKKRLENRHGKIRTMPGNWVFSPTKTQRERTVTGGSRGTMLQGVDADDKEMFLIHQRGVHCPRADLCKGNYPRSKEGAYWFLPLHVCRKCEHYRKGKRRGTPRYPCCKYEAVDNPEAHAVADTIEIFEAAAKRADEIMNR